MPLSWPQAILHIDADAFFTSCEEAIHPELTGKPIITGGERGIVACASYPAKRMGIQRGVPLHEARKICRGLIVLPSDYETYSLFSRRMFTVIKRFTDLVEEYSIDEAFADITGMRRALRASYAMIASNLQTEIQKELGITVSVGLSVTKVLAKVASKHNKPNGITVIPDILISKYLKDLPVEKIWGIGPATTSYLNKMGVKTALEFSQLPEASVRKRFTKPGVEIWQELRGKSVYPVTTEEKSVYYSICKTKTFAPPTSNPDYLLAHLLRNLESACIKARRYKLAPNKVMSMLKTQDFRYQATEIRLNRPSSQPLELSPIVHDAFNVLYQKKNLYRSTGIILLDLEPDRPRQYSLFEDPERAEKVRQLYEAIDEISGMYGKHSLHLGASHAIETDGHGRRGKPTVREQTRLLGETKRQHLNLPILHVKV